MLSYLLFVAIITGVYALLGLGLVVIWGQSGMVNLGLAGFFALGAYASALLTTVLSVPIVLGWLAAVVLAALIGLLVTWLTRSMRGDYLAIITLSFAEFIRLVAVNEAWLTNSIDGISGIPAPFRAALGDNFNLFYLVLTWTIVAIAYVAVRRLINAPFGRVLRAIRDDDQVAAVAGGLGQDGREQMRRAGGIEHRPAGIVDEGGGQRRAHPVAAGNPGTVVRA